LLLASFGFAKKMRKPRKRHEPRLIGAYRSHLSYIKDVKCHQQQKFSVEQCADYFRPFVAKG